MDARDSAPPPQHPNSVVRTFFVVYLATSPLKFLSAKVLPWVARTRRRSSCNTIAWRGSIFRKCRSRKLAVFGIRRPVLAVGLDLGFIRSKSTRQDRGVSSGRGGCELRPRARLACSFRSSKPFVAVHGRALVDAAGHQKAKRVDSSRVGSRETQFDVAEHNE